MSLDTMAACSFLVFPYNYHSFSNNNNKRLAKMKTNLPLNFLSNLHSRGICVMLEMKLAKVIEPS